MNPVWTDHYTDQAAVVTDIESKLRMLRDTHVPAAVTQVNTPPDETAFNDAWSVVRGGVATPPSYSKTHWYDPAAQQIRGIYQQLPTVSAVPKTVVQEQLSASSEVIDKFVVKTGDSLVTNWVVNLAKTYHSVWFYWSVRSTAAATSTTFRVRPNSLATSICSHASVKLTNTPSITYDGIYNNVGFQLATVPAATASSSLNYGHGSGQLFYPAETSQGKCGFFDAVNMINIGAGAGEFFHMSGGMGINTLSAITSLQFILTAGSFAVGSKILVIGFHPNFS